MRSLLETFRFFFSHHHDMRCTGKTDMSLTPRSERQYWHIHECYDCPKTKSVMNADCATFNRRRR